MNIFTGLCAVVFALLAPVVGVAGLLIKLGLSGPVALCIAAGLMTGVIVLWRPR